MSNVKIKQNGKWIPASIVDVEGIAMAGYQYSTDEQVVGCWTDGRPIYRKVYRNLSVTSAVKEGTPITTKLFDIDSINNICTLKGYANFLNGSNFYQWLVYGLSPTTTSVNKNLCLYYNTGSVYIDNSNPDWNGVTIDVTLEYTKTTDEENSFTIDMLCPTVEDTEATDEDVIDVFS